MEGYGNGGAAGFASPPPQFLGGHLAIPKDGISLNVAAPRQPHVTSEIERFSKATEHLHQIIAMLEDRLSAITVPSAPAQPGRSGESAQSSPVPLAAGLAVLNERVEHACSRLSSLVTRIEL
jgi:hypothetical protein